MKIFLELPFRKGPATEFSKQLSIYLRNYLFLVLGPPPPRPMSFPRVPQCPFTAQPTHVCMIHTLLGSPLPSLAGTLSGKPDLCPPVWPSPGSCHRIIHRMVSEPWRAGDGLLWDHVGNSTALDNPAGLNLSPSCWKWPWRVLADSADLSDLTTTLPQVIPTRLVCA